MLPETISFTNSPDVQLGSFLKGTNYSQIGVLMDENTANHCYPIIKKGLPPHQTLQLHAGEEHKNINSCEKVWHQLTEFGFDRHSLLIVLGGGVLGDLGGFCAATYKRGIDFLLVPTTLLSQTDASIGGKLGIDFQNYKNHIGLFQDPVCTLISTVFLKTLPDRELRSGFAEIIKHCLTSDRAKWDIIRNRSFEDQDWEDLIRHSVEFKFSVISKDPKEKGLRKILNFGHSVGHAIEGYFLESGDRIFHGEAVAAGMVAESFIALKMGLITQAELDAIVTYITELYGPFKPLGAGNDVIKRIGQDKKNEGKRILMALPEGIGKAVWDVEVSEELIVDSLDFLSSH